MAEAELVWAGEDEMGLGGVGDEQVEGVGME